MMRQAPLWPSIYCCPLVKQSKIITIKSLVVSWFVHICFSPAIKWDAKGNVVTAIELSKWLYIILLATFPLLWLHYINPQEYLWFDTLDFNDMSLIAMVLASKKLQCNQPVLHFVVGHWETQGTDGKLQFAASHSWKHVDPNSLRAEDESKISHKYPGWYRSFLNFWWQNSFAKLVYTQNHQTCYKALVSL